MNKKRLISIIILIVIIIVGIGIWLYILSFHTIRFTLPEGVHVSLYKKVDTTKKTIQTLSSSKTLSLQDGTYCTTASDSVRFDTASTCFAVSGKNMSVSINPNYSKAYLAQLLSSQLSIINTVINNRYAPIISQFTVDTGYLYGTGEWYGTTLTQIGDGGNRGDTYRLVLEKQNGTWKIIAYPQIVLSKYDYPQIPFAILDSVNQLPGSY